MLFGKVSGGKACLSSFDTFGSITVGNQKVVSEPQYLYAAQRLSSHPLSHLKPPRPSFAVCLLAIALSFKHSYSPSRLSILTSTQLPSQQHRIRSSFIRSSFLQQPYTLFKVMRQTLEQSATVFWLQRYCQSLRSRTRAG
jgi:hypothetical protein